MAGILRPGSITVRRGDSFDIVLHLMSGGRDFDLDACSVKMSVKNETGQLLLSKTGEIFASAEGKARLKLTAADTNLVPGTYRTDIQVTFKNGDVHTVFPQDINQVGVLIITPDVTEEEDGSI